MSHSLVLTPDSTDRADQRDEVLRVVLDACQRAYWGDDPEARAARDYVARRGLSDDHARDFGLGYFSVRVPGLVPDHMLAAFRDLAVADWHGRVVVPWFGVDGEILTLYSRLVDAGPGDEPGGEDGAEAPKRTLAARGAGSKGSPFMFDRALRACRDRHLVLVEGVFDALVLHAMGATDVISPVSNRLSDAQVETLKDHCIRRVTICLDPDRGGATGTPGCVQKLQAAGIEALVAPGLPDGLDPDEFVLRDGIHAWRRHIAEAVLKPRVTSPTAKSPDPRTESARRLHGHLDGVEEGRRDETIFRSAARMRALDVDEDTAKEMIRKQATACSPPFSEAEAEKKVERVYKAHEPGNDQQIAARNAHKTLEGIVGRSRAEPSAAFHPDVLKALHDLRRYTPGDYECVRSALKGAGVRVSALDPLVAQARHESASSASVPDIVRHVRERGESIGWFILQKDGTWMQNSMTGAKMVLQARLGVDQSRQVFADELTNSWEQTRTPFSMEYPRPGERIWNREGAQFAFTAVPGEHPTWNLMFQHLGRNLDYYVAQHPWCEANGIHNGASYLLHWTASVVQRPFQPLPYLFLFGPEENGGKSTFHEALKLQIPNGVVIADKALTSTGDFNKELEGAVIAVVEEVNLRREIGRAGERIKLWTTAKTISIMAKGGTPYEIPNSLHWVQTANRASHCPIFSGDTRITMIRVDRPEQDIPKEELLSRLKQEGPAFTATIQGLRLPPAPGRLGLPIIETAEKKEQKRSNESLLSSFLNREQDWKALRPDEVHREMARRLDPQHLERWNEKKVERELSDHRDAGRILATAVRDWIEDAGEPWHGSTAALKDLLDGEVRTWTAEKLGVHLPKVVPSLKRVGIIAEKSQRRGPEGGWSICPPALL